ncbi:zn-finger domain-containing protein [Gigaspora margarita]|uniref:Zn-finger domain-containing protein n=1 Tax=Gigaspora margarita TaxID=4874 RepID=A0A8H3XHN9_GIGMA|nr:zn-finger domain-containing protein [Gigaspora margarita]
MVQRQDIVTKLSAKSNQTAKIIYPFKFNNLIWKFNLNNTQEFINEELKNNNLNSKLHFGSVTIQNGLKIHTTNSYYGKACYSNVAIAINFEKLSEYLSDHGICYEQICLLAKIELEAKIFNLALIQWYDFKSKKTLFYYRCSRLQLTKIYNIINIEAIKDNVHIISRFDKNNNYLVNKYIF